ncbi:MAG: hypothetical protein GY768_00855 [Planctomycetaceae bacterium]|nr:hypothetical protein [Planctomycetaceae bacterium]
MSTTTVLPPKARVILVHGTFAARDGDVGDSWWQQGSSTWNELQKRLPVGTDLVDQGQVFHWSGENSERARIKAGQDLLKLFRRFEEEGVGYHVIGHSHGGSVIWHALRSAELQNYWLPRLHSWATVGTPFLQHQTRSRWSLINAINIVLALVLLKPAYTTFRRLVQYSIAAITGGDIEILTNATNDSAIVQIVRAPGLKILELLGVPVNLTGEKIQVGSFDPSSGDSFVNHLFMTTEGITILIVAVIYIYVLVNLAFMFLNPVLESLRMRSEKRLEQRCSQRFGKRWLGIWSPDDEAINGLTATLRLSVSFVAKMGPRERVLFSDVLSLVSQPYYWLLSPIFNRFIRPLLDDFIRSYIAKTAQGNNRPAAEVVGVSEVPLSTVARSSFPPIPAWINARIVASSNRYTVDLAPKLRRLLSSTCILTGLDAFGHELSGRELVHTSYFEHSEIQDLLAMHIAWSIDDFSHAHKISAADERLLAWYQTFRIASGSQIPSELSVPPAKHQSLPPIRPRRNSPQRRAA